MTAFNVPVASIAPGHSAEFPSLFLKTCLGCANAAANGWEWITGEKISKKSSLYTFTGEEDDGLVLALKKTEGKIKLEAWTGAAGDTDVEFYICQNYH